MQAGIRKRVLFFTCEPGGAEVLIPVIKLLSSREDFEAIAVGYGLALPRFSRKNLACREILPVRMNDFSLLDEIRPDWLITSATSLPERDMSEKHLWHNARKMGIPSLAFLDQWQNYIQRFSGPGKQDRLLFLPDYINCINSMGEREMLEEGFSAARLVKFGHPYLSSLRQMASQVDAASVRRKLNCSGEQLALFVSEPIRENYGNSRGYDQYAALTLFLGLIEQAKWRQRPLVKLHPKDNPSSYADILRRFRHLEPLLVTDALDSLECLSIVDTVFGMTSIMLIEAFVLGKAVISLQPNLKGEDPLVLSRYNLVPRITMDGLDAIQALGWAGMGRDTGREADLDFAFGTEELIRFL